MVSIMSEIASTESPTDAAIVATEMAVTAAETIEDNFTTTSASRARTYSHTTDVSVRGEEEDLHFRILCEEVSVFTTEHNQRVVQIQRWMRRCIWRRRMAVRVSKGTLPAECDDSVECLDQSARLDVPTVASSLQRIHVRSRSSGDMPMQVPQMINSSWVDTSAQLRVLLVFANPRGTSNLRLQAEERAIREALYGGAHNAQITLDVLPAATVDDLAKRLTRQQYDLIHFSGHADRVTLLMQHMIERFRMEHGIDPAVLRNNNRAVRVVERAVDGAVCEIEQLLLKQHPELERRHTVSGNADVINVYGPPKSDKHLPQLYPSNNPTLDCVCRTKGLALPTYTLETTDMFDEEVKVALDVTIDDHKTNMGGRSYHIHQNISSRDVLDMGVGSLAFEGDAGDLTFVRPESFARLLSEYCPPLRCVILNACGSKLQGGVLSQVIPLTVCFGGKVADRESMEFSKGFYDALGNGRSYEDAYMEGAKRMDLHALDPGMPFRPAVPIMSFSDREKGTLPTALVSLFRNVPLLHELQHFRSETAAPPVSQGIVVNGRTYTTTEIEEAINMNTQLKSLVAYGVKVLESKDEQIADLKMRLQPPSAAPKGQRRLLTGDSVFNNQNTDRRRGRTPAMKKDVPTRRRSNLASEVRRAWTKPPSPVQRVSVAQRTTAASRAAQVSKKDQLEFGTAVGTARELDTCRVAGAAATNEPTQTSANHAVNKRRPVDDSGDGNTQKQQHSFGSRVPRFFDVPDSKGVARPVVSVTYSPRKKPENRMTSPVSAKRTGHVSAPNTPSHTSTK